VAPPWPTPDILPVLKKKSYGLLRVALWWAAYRISHIYLAT